MTLPTFPSLPGLMWPVKRTNKWSTLPQVAISGRESRQGMWSYPRYSYELAYELLRQAPTFQEWQTLQGFFNQVGGSRDVFQFVDVNDGSVSAQGFGVGDSSTKSFQLVRSLGSFAEPVYAPTGTPTITVAGTPTSSFTLGNYGVVTFASAPTSGAALAWSGSFNWLCRFDNDTAEFSNFAYALWELQQLTFTTVKP